MSENKTPKTIAERAAAAPTDLHLRFQQWLKAETGIDADLKTIQLAVIFRMDFQASPANQAVLADRKAKAAADKKASAARKKAKLEAELAKLTGKVAAEETPAEIAETVQAEKEAEATRATEEADKAEAMEPVKLTVVYGDMGEPQVHKFGCADLKKMTRAKGYSKETATVSSHTELTHLIYSDMIDSGESSLKDNYMAYDAKPCCPALDN
ncbi:hypothetical protein SEA_YARA_89 [Streptomyces phage Yara]|nr:hypothetical protein SEA_YARA_89 [Streptomyces phage Yara]